MDYTKLAKTAEKLIKANGTICYLINPSNEPPIYNHATNEYEEQSGKFAGLCIISNYEDKLIDGTVIQTGDIKVTTILSSEPQPNLSKLEVEGKLYQIINSSPIAPDAKTVIVYKLQCRK